MSKQDIINLTSLAAHLSAIEMLMTREAPDEYMSRRFPAHHIAADAMKLQRLGRSASNNATRLCNIPNYQERHDINAGRIHAQATEILKKYDLKCTVEGDPRGFCLFIQGLPGNTLGGDEAGYGV